MVVVQLIDFGRREYCSYTNLQHMNGKFLKQPKLAIRCHLAEVISLSKYIIVY